MSDSEEDYMSDAFLAKCQDTTPGLVSDKVKKQYKKDVRIKELNVKNRIKPLKVLEVEKRTEGLCQVIGEGNKGFSLLQKMGYKPGMAIGKKGTGRAEPIPIHVRTGRGGLGEDTERKRKQQEMTSMRVAMVQKRQKREATFQKDYRAERSRLMQEKKAEGDLYKSQRVCEQLDEEQRIEEPDELYYWTPAKMSLLLKQAEAEQLSDTEDTDYVDIETSRMDRVATSTSSCNAEDENSDTETFQTRLYGESDDDVDDEKLLPPMIEQLRVLTHYLRSRYLYCVWCGTRFDDTEDITQNCPGNTSEAHDS